MVLHILGESEYTNCFVDFVQKYYSPDEEHFFIIYCSEDRNILNINDHNHIIIVGINYDRKIINQYAVGARKIIIHGLFWNKDCLWILKNPKYHSRIVVSIWGGELYSHKKIMEDNSLSPFARIYDFIKGMALRKIDYFVNDMPEDYILMKEWFHVKGKSIYAVYPQISDYERLSEIRKRKERTKKDKIVRILVGNSATDSNQHMQVFEILEKYSGNNIKVYCPLSYGDLSYRDKIVKSGYDILGKCFIPVMDYMSSDQYVEFLAKMDVAIFNNNRQQAMGNIATLGFLGAKLYLRNDTTMWERYVRKGGCNFYNVGAIVDMEFNDFVGNKAEDIIINYQYFKKLWDPSEIKVMWDRVLC